MGSEMSRIGQAVFTSARTDFGVGYHVVAASRGVSKADRRALSIWGPSHDSLLLAEPDAVSFNFFPLPSGDFCVSRTSAVGWEYSGRGGARIHTHCLIAPPETLVAFTNHPLTLARAATEAGVFNHPAEIPTSLETLQLTDKKPIVDPRSQTLLSDQADAEQVAVLVQSVLESDCTVAVASRLSTEKLIAGLFDRVPVPCRTSISFSTGLRYSSQRPFRILPLPDDPPTRRWLARQRNVMVLDLGRA